MYVQKPQGNQLEYQPQLLYLRHHLQKEFRTRLGIQYLQWKASTLSEQKPNIHEQKALNLNLLINALTEGEEKKRVTPDQLYLRPVFSRARGQQVSVPQEAS